MARTSTFHRRGLNSLICPASSSSSYTYPMVSRFKMRFKELRTGILTVVLIQFLVTIGCSSSIALFSPTAYEQGVSLKVESLALVERALEPYEKHREAVELLILNIQKAREYAHGRPKNEISVRQWDVLMEPDKGLLGDVLERWETEGQLSEIYLREKLPYIAAAYDQIIGLESGKVKSQSLKQD